MFTGLIADVGRVRSLRRDDDGVTLAIETALAAELGLGDSVAVNGVCLSATAVEAGAFAAEAINETLARSSLGALAEGARVNLELPVRADDRLGGHIVQGHVDGPGRVAGVREDGFARVVEIELAPELLRYVVLKGSIALDGVSLTVSDLSETGLAVSLIPETLTRTTLGDLRGGAIVNVEVDVLAKHVERLLADRPASLTAQGRP